MKRALQSCSILLLLYTATAHAQLYKWVGPDGKVTYSDTPPPIAAERLETRPAAPATTISGVGLPFELTEAIRNHPVTLYTTRNCIPCDEGRKLLSQRGIPFSEKTVNTSEDAAQFRQVGGESQLPLLTIGRTREQGYDAEAWNTALSAAGYPKTSRLPGNYRNPPAQAAAPAVKPESTEQEKAAATTKDAPPASSTDLPPALGNAPPGFRF